MNSYNHLSGSDLQRLRRKRRNRIIIISFFCLLGVIVILESPLTRVREITVSGNTSIPEKKLLKEAAIHKGDSLWQVNAAAITASITKQEPLVQSVHVHTDFWNGLVSISVAQKHVTGILEVDGKFYNLLSDGTVYNALNAQNGFSLPIITDQKLKKVQIGMRVPDSDVTNLCRALSTLQSSEIQHIAQINLDGLGSSTLYMDNNYEVMLSVSDIRKQLSGVGSVVDYFVNKGYPPGLIDMSGQPPYRYTPFHAGKGS